MNLSFPVALKTGTTKAFTDNWAVGVTREFSVGVWSGNFDGSPTHQVMSVEGATPLLRDVYTAIAARYGDPSAPPRPSGVVQAPVCPLSGLRPGPHCPHRKPELFVAGALPDKVCDWHQWQCEKVHVVYPDAVHHWAQTVGKPLAPVCSGASRAVLTIASPADGSRFILEPHRPAQFQRPVFRAVPHNPGTRWSVDGVPMQEWTPNPGRHKVVAELGNYRDEVIIEYE